MYGRANEHVEWIRRNIAVNRGSIETKLLIWLMFVNGIRAIEMKMIE